MESEKVKEIKKALECCSTPLWTKCDNCSRADEDSLCMYRLQADALTLINELESENEKLSNTEISELIKENEELEKQCEEWSGLAFKKIRKVFELKDRIAELEKENAKLLDSVETVQNNRCVYKSELTKNQLKQFAERLKEKYGKSCSEYYPLLLELTSEQLDETLNEFLKGENNE